MFAYNALTVSYKWITESLLIMQLVTYSLCISVLLYLHYHLLLLLLLLLLLSSLLFDLIAVSLLNVQMLWILRRTTTVVVLLHS